MKYAINLFPARKSQLPRHIGHFLAYYLRYSLLITLCVVLMVFFLRVQIDNELSDEKEKLSMRQAIIVATQPLRNDLDNMQTKISIIKEIFVTQDELNSEIEYVTGIIPKKTLIQSITVNGKNVQIEGLAQDFRIVQLLLGKLGQDNKFANVSLANISKEKNNTYVFTIALEGYVDIKKETAIK